MRRAAPSSLFLCLGLACARAPSSVPLGGQEWLRPEPHFDRRAADGPEPVAAPPSAPIAPPHGVAAVADAGAAPPPVPSTTAGELAFAFKPLARGESVTLRTRYTIRANFSTSFQGASMSQSAQMDSAERIEIRVTEASADEVRELDVEYVESKSSFRMSEMPADDDSNAGKRYRVAFRSGSASVTPKSGTLGPNEDKGVLLDLATVTGYVPLVKPHLPATLAPGWRAKLAGSELVPMFGSIESVRFDGATLALRGRDAGDANLAIFECTLPVHFERDGMQLSADLRGTCSARPSDSRPVHLALSGPLRADSSAMMGGTSTLSGTIEVDIDHGYH